LVNDRLEDSVEILQSIVRAGQWLRSGDEISDDKRTIISRADSCRLENVGQRLKPILASFKAAVESGRPS
ncbi:MAG: hypothetical protein WA859_17590, partial [Candidatus Sulfotelmatobacter sp.]